MKKWLLVATQGDRLDSLGTVAVKAFTSGDGDEPHSGDLSEAALDLAARVERRQASALESGKLEAVLVPLTDARILSLTLERTASVVWSAGPV